MKALALAAALYRSEHADCPTTDDLARERIIDPNRHVTDPWGNPFEIRCSSGDVWIESPGPDESRHTDDDLDSRLPPSPRTAWRSR
jgi:hypothetical protein